MGRVCVGGVGGGGEGAGPERHAEAGQHLVSVWVC
jgi:hypothetical protein